MMERLHPSPYTTAELIDRLKSYPLNTPEREAADRLEELSAWRPMETAPKDGAAILACHKDSIYGPFQGFVVLTVSWRGYISGGKLCWRDLAGNKVEVTHWKPLPAPPPPPQTGESA